MKYRKKPVVIEARQLTEDADWHDIAEWCAGTLVNREEADTGDYCTELVIWTLEGTMRADAGDWIIRGVKGEFYPCKPDIFAATYEAVES